MIRKKLLVAAVFVAAVCALSGCGNSKESENSTAAEATTEASATEVVPVELNASEYVKLGEYKGLTIEGASLTVTDEEIEEELESLQQDYIEYEEISRKTVKDSDYVNVDCAAEIDGEENDDYSESDLDIQMGAGSLDVSDDVDVDSQIIGAKVGDTVTVDFTFADDYEDTEVAGKKCTLEISINAIEKEVVPELTDAFIKENTGSETLEAYRKELKEELEDTKKSDAEDTNRSTLWEKVVNNAEQIEDFPEDAIAQQTSNIKAENEEWASYYGMDVDEFVEQFYEMSIEEYAKSTLKEQCVQDLIAQAENIEVTDEDVDEEIQTYIDDYGYEDKEEILEVMSEEEIREEIQYTKIIDKLMEETTIKEAD